MAQGVLTVIAEILPDRVEGLTALLVELGSVLDGDTPGTPIIDFPKFERIHFARFVVLPKDAEGKQSLAFSTAYDGPRALHLSEMATLACDGFCKIYEHCVGFPESARTAPATLMSFLTRSLVPYGAMHVGYVGRTVRDIRQEEALRRYIEERLGQDCAATRPGTATSAMALRERIVDLLRASEFRWALEPRAARIARSSVENWWTHPLALGLVLLALVGFGGGAFVFGGAVGLVGYVASVLGGAGLVVLVLRIHEEGDSAKADTDMAQGLEHADDEDFGLRNQLSHIVDVKPGAFRHVLIRAVLFAVEFRARFQFYKGDLGGLETIHCAHWTVIGKKAPRLLFFSNYDGSWERYLGDFIEEAGGGMTSVWSSTVDFPRTRFLLWGGVTNERVFKAWTRERQIKTQVWYAATPEISIRNVTENSLLRDGLRGYMTEEEARAWLRLL